MPIPPPPIFWIGPATAAAAKAAAYEYLPALSSASLAALLGKLAWKRLPDWIKEDVVWKKNTKQTTTKQSSSSKDRPEKKEEEHEKERLSTIWEKIQAWMEHASEQVLNTTPVPYLWASLLIYWQLCTQLDTQQQQQQSKREDEDIASDGEAENNDDSEAEECGADDDAYDDVVEDSEDEMGFETAFERTKNDITVSTTVLATHDEVLKLKQKLNLATWAYYIDDEPFLRDQLARHEANDHDDDNGGYELLQCFVPTRPGSVGYYMAEKTTATTETTGGDQDTGLSLSTKTLLIGIRGTASLEELLTDSCGRSVPYRGSNTSTCSSLSQKYHKDEDHSSWHSTTRIEVQAQCDDQILYQQHQQQYPPAAQDGVEIVSGHERIWMEQSSFHDDSNKDDDDDSHGIQCHEGIMIAAQRLLKQVEPMIRERVLNIDNSNTHSTDAGSCQRRQLLLVGHSLGASAACLLALMLRLRHPELMMSMSCNNDHHSTSRHASTNNNKKLQVFAFAPPPCLDHDSAIASQLYVTSVVHRSDLIARCSLANVAVLLELLRTISDHILTARGMAPVGPVGTTALLRQLARGATATTSGRDHPLWTKRQLQQAMTRAEQTVQLRHPHHLYVPGKLYFLDCPVYDDDETPINTRTPPVDDEKKSTNDDLLQQKQQQPHGNEQGGASAPIENATNAAAVDSKYKKYSCTLMDVTAPTLRTIVLSGYRMLGDHTTSAYHAALDSILLDHQTMRVDASGA